MATAGAKKKKPRRQALPGGAPLKAVPGGKSRKRATKPSSAPSRATAATSRQAPSAKKGKAPCKYGPRLANGRCPTKPRGERNRLTVSSRTVEGASKQATSVILNPRSTKAQKVEAVSKVAEAAAVETVKETAKKINASPTLAAAKAAIKKAAPLAIGISAPLAAGAAVGVLRYKVAKRRRETDMSPEGRALRALAEVERNMKRKLTPAERRTLFKQHVEYFKSR